ncbi:MULTISPECIES: ribokinase [unclassified Oleiphilus]|uniref:ribokinase n=1 Tax=unclassified Oleiphilus TaxID=2631174 RepID=UPI0007C3A830|nr:MULTISPECIES: ribokinase [unclassified Oleiphilus]KZY63807.1 ribokinase [Oleiphilus sp. HI0066]KZY70607.1 ribokinase [Oleiphilus sp. HI0067]
MSQLVVLGSVNADHVLQVPSFPRPGETLLGRNYQVIPGGKGANQAVAAARLGADVCFIASVGDDTFGQNMLDRFRADGIDISKLHVQLQTPTGIAMIQVADSGENSICLSAEANDALTEELVNLNIETITQADTLLLQLETPMDGVRRAVQAAHAAGTQVVLNPAPAQALDDQLLACVDIITPNETEAEVLTGVSVTDDLSAQLAANVLHEKGIDCVLITLGAKGVWLSMKGDAVVSELIAGFRVQALDTTAAGDTFNAGLVTAMLEGKTIDEAIRFAHAAAAISVTRFGAQTSIPERSKVDAFIDAS